MSDLLIRELSNTDIDWLVQTGTRRSLAPEEILIRPDQEVKSLFILLEGKLSICLPNLQAMKQGQLACDNSGTIARGTRGELLGESWLFNTKPVVLVMAAEETVVLDVPKEALLDKLKQDIAFAAHFYRVLALIMSERIRNIFEQPEKVRYGSKRLVKEALSVFSELRDSDIDWMVSSGKVKKLTSEQRLLKAGRPVDALYTVLDGQFAIAMSDKPCDPLSLCFEDPSDLKPETFKTATYISRGGLPGIISFLDFQPLPVTISAVKEALVLSIPRQQVAIKLQEDMGFASRFYRVICTQTVNLLRSVTLLRGEASDEPGMDNAQDGEMDLDELQQVCHGGTKFDWMLKQLGVGCG